MTDEPTNETQIAPAPIVAEECAEAIRAALDARGLEIRSKNDD